VNLTLTDFIRKDNSRSVQGKLHPSGRFSVVQLFSLKRKSPKYAKNKLETPQGLRTVQELDDTYARLLRSAPSTLREVSPGKENDSQDVGLSDVPISPKRSKRGSRGINSRQRDILCWGAATLERIYTKANLSFLTLTLPPLTPEDLKSVQDNWGDITNRVVLRIKEKLNGNGIDSAVVGCTELQMDRYADTGMVYPHLHLVMRGRRDGHSDWAIKPHQFRRIWRGCVSRFLSEDSHDWRASENVQPVRKSVAGYLAKYMSKCASKNHPDVLSRWHPRDWIVLGRRIRALYESMSYVGYELGCTLYDVVRSWKPGLGYVNSIYIRSGSGDERRIGYCGWLRGEERYPTYAELHPYVAPVAEEVPELRTTLSVTLEEFLKTQMC